MTDSEFDPTKIKDHGENVAENVQKQSEEFYRPVRVEVVGHWKRGGDDLDNPDKIDKDTLESYNNEPPASIE